MYYTIRAFFNGEIEELSDEFFFENKKEYLYTRPDKESLNSFLYTISSEIRRQRYYYCHPDDLFLLCTPAYNMYRRNHGASAQQLLLFFLLYNWIMIQASSSHENLSSRELESFFETGVYPLLLLSFALVDIWKPYGTSVHTHNAQRERVTEGCSGAGSCYLGFCISLSSSSDTFESIYLWLTRLWIVIMSRVSWARCLTYCTSRRSMLGALSAI
jgi:hypothetical protein